MTFLRWYQATSSPFPNVLLCCKSRNWSTVPTRLRLEPHANGNTSLIWDFQPAKVIRRLWLMLTVKSVLKENLNMAKSSLNLLLWFSDAQCPRDNPRPLPSSRRPSLACWHSVPCILFFTNSLNKILRICLTSGNDPRPSINECYCEWLKDNSLACLLL